MPDFALAGCVTCSTTMVDYHIRSSGAAAAGLVEKKFLRKEVNGARTKNQFMLDEQKLHG